MLRVMASMRDGKGLKCSKGQEAGSALRSSFDELAIGKGSVKAPRPYCLGELE